MEGLKRPVVRRGFDGGHVYAKGGSVNVVRACAGHQFVGHIVSINDVVVFSGSLIRNTQPLSKHHRYTNATICREDTEIWLLPVTILNEK